MLMKNGTVEEVAAEVRRLIEQGSPLKNFSIDTVGLTYGTPDDNVIAARKAAAEYGKFSRETKTARKTVVFSAPAAAKTPVETIIRSASQEVVIGRIHPLVIIGEQSDRGYYRDILNLPGTTDLVGKTTIAEAFYLIQTYAKLALCVDSSILHIASYLNKPLVALFGPTDPARYGPWSDHYLVLRGDNPNNGIHIPPAKINQAVNKLWTSPNAS